MEKLSDKFNRLMEQLTECVANFEPYPEDRELWAEFEKQKESFMEKYYK